MNFQKGHIPWNKNKKITSNTGRTWWKKDREPWNKGTHIVLKPRTGKIIVCKLCGKKKYFELNQLKKRPCLYCSIKCSRFDSRRQDIGYSGIHSRIRTDYGKADICEECKSNKNVEWANLPHTYKMIRTDWKKMCRSCHFKYDYKTGWGIATRDFISLTR